MISSRIARPVVVWVGFLACTFPSDTLAEVTIRLEGLPGSLPAYSWYRDAKNSVLTATISGGAVKSVWLSCVGAPAHRILLTRVSEADFQVNLQTSEVLKSMEAEENCTEFRVHAETGDGQVASSIVVPFRRLFTPRKLELSKPSANFRITQRSSLYMPGSREIILVHLGDVTAGEVSLRADTMSGAEIIAERRVREGDDARFVLADTEYVLHLDRMVNLPIGDDYCEFTVASVSDWERLGIERILNLIETSELTFIRNGEEGTGARLAAHLRDKLEKSGRKDLTAGQFVEQIASRSTASGKPYLVKFASGDTQPVGDWLRTQLAGGAARAESPPTDRGAPGKE